MAAPKKYFEYFPSINFEGRQIKDLTRRATFLRDIQDDYRLVGFYKIKSGETPWGLTHDFYGSEEYDWILFGLNNIVNPFFDWCLSQVELERLISLKYPGETRYDIHHYVFQDRIYYEPVIFEDYWQAEYAYGDLDIVIPSVVDGNGVPTIPFRFKVIARDGNEAISGASPPSWPGTIGSTITDGDITWENIGPYQHPESVFVTNQEFEEIENEKRRIIKVLRPQYLTAIMAEFDKTMRGVLR